MTAETFREFGRSFVRAPLPWLGMILLAAGSDYVDLIRTPAGSGFSDLQVISLIVRFVGVFWLGAVLLRRLAGTPANAWTLDGGIVFFIVWQLVIFVLEGVVGFMLSTAKNVSAEIIVVPVDPYVLTLIFIALAVPIVDLLVLKIAPWVVARTARTADTKFGKAWRAMRGQCGDAARAYFVLVFPLFIVHYVLTAWLPRAHIDNLTRLECTIGDGIVSIVMLTMLLALYSVCFKRARPSAA